MTRSRSAPPPWRALSSAARNRLRRLHGAILAAERDIADRFPTAVDLSFTPVLADSVESTPQDLVVADLLVALRDTRVAIVCLACPIALVEDPPTAGPDDSF